MSGYDHDRVNVAVAVDDESRDSLCEVAAACRALGFQPTSTLNDIGVLTGSAHVASLPELREVPGVMAVEVARPFRTQAISPRLRRASAVTARSNLRRRRG